MKSTAPAARRAASPLLLPGSGSSATVRPLAADPSIAHLTIAAAARLPCPAQLREWGGVLRDHGYRALRTGAIPDRAARELADEGFRVVQDLALLSLDLDSWSPAAGARHPTKRLRRSDVDGAAVTDRAAFGVAWAMDASTIHDTLTATPFRRARQIGDIDAYAVTGRSGRHGFVQRLAVAPAAQRLGLGRSLVDDGLSWLRRRRARQVFVNTQVDNAPALQLYARAGFAVLPEGLRVMELGWS